MANTPSKYSKFTITSIPDPNSGGLMIPDYEKDMRAIVNQAVKSALSEGGYFKTASRVVDKQTGESRLDVYVHSEDASVVSDSLKTELGKLTYRDSWGRPTSDPKYALSTLPVTEKEGIALAREESGDGEVTRFNRGAWLKLLGLIGTLTDITRRILSSVLSFATQTTRDMVTAHNLGMSYEAVRNYRHVETIHGLKEGTITEAVADIQNKFGNITKLDEKALEDLAVVMGGKISEMATLGLGSSNPEAILGAILDDFNEKANAGYNSVGQYVGEQQARRELYSYLLKISPQIADIFATMQEEQHNINSLYRGQAETFEQWKNLMPTSRGENNTPMNYNVTVSMGKEWNVVKEVFQQMKEGLAVTLAPAVMEYLRRIADSRIGMSEKEKQERNKENRASNLRELASVNAQMKQAEDNWANLSAPEKEYYFALKQYKEELEKANKGNRFTGNIAYAVRTPEEIRVLANIIAKGDRNVRQAYGTDIAPTPDEILGVIEGYGKFDLNKERAKYEGARSKANAMEIEGRKKAEVDRLITEAEADYISASTTKGDPEYVSLTTRANNSEYKHRKMVGTVVRLYNDKDFYDKDGKLKKYEDLAKIAFAKKYLITSGNMSEWGINEAMVGDNLVNLAEIASQVAKENPVFDEEDFLYWLYSLNSSYFNEKILGVRYDEAVADSIKGNRLASLYALQTTEGTKSDWRNKLPTGYTGGGVIVGRNDYENGEVVHRIILKADVNGKQKEFELGSFLGMTGYDSVIGELDITNTNGKTNYAVVMGTAGSDQAKANSDGE